MFLKYRTKREREAKISDLCTQIARLEFLYKHCLSVQTASELLEACWELQQLLESKAK